MFSRFTLSWKNINWPNLNLSSAYDFNLEESQILSFTNELIFINFFLSLFIKRIYNNQLDYSKTEESYSVHLSVGVCIIVSVSVCVGVSVSVCVSVRVQFKFCMQHHHISATNLVKVLRATQSHLCKYSG